MRPLVSFALVLSLLGASPSVSASDSSTPRTVRILFIGNSLTYANDLPAQLVSMAKRDQVSVVTRSVTLPNYSLGDHIQDGRALEAIRNGPWDFVVMQQGPSGLEASRTDLIRDTRILARAIADAKARVVLYMVWPSRTRMGDFARVSESYRLAAEAVGGLFAPAGDVWRSAWKRDSRISLYGPDGFHPSAAGSYLAALTLYRVMIGSIPPALGTEPVARAIAGSSFHADARQARIMVEVAEKSE